MDKCELCGQGREVYRTIIETITSGSKTPFPRHYGRVMYICEKCSYTVYRMIDKFDIFKMAFEYFLKRKK